MKRRSIYVLAAVILLSLALLPVSAAAAETGVTVEIPVEVHRTGAAMDPCEIFEIVLTPDDAGAPPPDTDTLRCTALEDGPGNAPGGFSFTVAAPGSYRYTVRERCGSCAGMTYDDTVYQLLVTAQYGADGKLDASVSASSGGAEKSDRIVFYNAYDTRYGIKDLVVNKVWNDGGYARRPAEVTLALLKNGEVYERFTLSKNDGWSKTFPAVCFDAETEWTVQESPVPDGYRAAYTVRHSDDGRTCYLSVTNSRKKGGLIDTGLQRAPVPVLAGSGAALLFAGLLRRRKDSDA